jgi:mono/diheme cytochrome c family protein
MKAWQLVGPLCLLTALLPLFAREKPAAGSPPPPGAKAKSATYSSEGERIFHNQCSRCHDAPQGFPPQISGTVIRHMRVRASLSAKDEQELLHFLNP